MVLAKSVDEARSMLGESAVNRSEILNQSMQSAVQSENPFSGAGQFTHFKDNKMGNLLE